MSDGVLSSTIPGKPVTKGSWDRYFRNSNKRTKAWAQELQLRCRDELPHGWELWEGPCKVHITANFARPKSHYNKAGLKPSAPLYHTQKPDSDKIARAVLDALSGCVYADDCQVTYHACGKEWADTSSTEVEVFMSET